MKKIIALLSIALAFIVTACDPLEDTYKELDQTVPQNKEVTLQESDYTDALDLSTNSFASEKQAEEKILTFLKNKFGDAPNNSVAKVNYKLNNIQDSLIVYTVTTEDYDAYDATSRFNNFSAEDQITTFLKDKFPDENDLTLVSLTYKFYNGSVNTLNNGFLKSGNDWVFIKGITDDEYTDLEERFPNFSSVEEAKIKIPVMLNEAVENDRFGTETPEEGTIQTLMYKVYTKDTSDVDKDGRTDDSTAYSYVANYVFSNGVWAEKEGVLEKSLQYKVKKGAWASDNTIIYTLVRDDFNAIGEEFADKYPDPSTSAGRYGNFDTRSGNSAEWTAEMRIEALNFFLNQKDAAAGAGTKYELTFATYNGSSGTITITLVKGEDGNWTEAIEE